MKLNDATAFVARLNEMEIDTNQQCVFTCLVSKLFLNRLGKPSVPESVPELVTIWLYRLTQTSYSDMRRLIEFYFFLSWSMFMRV
jgi:hypothetical protein